ncbi:hypothetical protein E4U53_007008 [Claviceps sorghi]|nr:hypothetical protein E4U53_007008 [Claviceps sorghi]
MRFVNNRPCDNFFLKDASFENPLPKRSWAFTGFRKLSQSEKTNSYPFILSLLFNPHKLAHQPLMPPRAAGRRQARFSSREPENSPSQQNGLSTFQKPNLPPLQGTPSSRRQYSYGADVEPMPSRPGHGLQRTQVRDISSAVRSVLTRHEAEEEEQEGSKAAKVQGQREQRQSVVAPRRHEHADAPQQSRYRPSYLSEPPGLDDGTHPQFSTRNQAPDGSDVDDVRSFGMESDFYGDATIDSTPKAPPLEPAQPSPLGQVRTLNNRSGMDALRRSTHQKHLDPNGEDHVDLVRQAASRSRVGPANFPIGPSPLRSAPRHLSQVATGSTSQPLPPAQARGKARGEQEAVEEEQEDEDEDEEELDQPDGGDLDAIDEQWEHEQNHAEEEESDDGEPTRQHNLRHTTNTNTPAPRRRLLSTAHEPPRTRLSGPLPVLPPPQAVSRSQLQISNGEHFGQTGRGRPVQAPNLRSTQQGSDDDSMGRQELEESEEAEEASQDSSESGRWLTRTTGASNFASLFANAKMLASSSPFTFSRRYPIDQTERDAAIQRDIDEAEADLAREHRLQASDESRQRRQRRWPWIKSFVPFAGQAHADADDVSSMRQDQLRLGFARVLHYINPMTYLRGLVALIGMLLDWVTTLVHYIIPSGLWDRLSSVFEFLPHIIAGLLAFMLAFVLATQFASSAEGNWMPNAVESTTRAFADMGHKVYDLVPTISWSKREGRWAANFDDLWDDNDGDGVNGAASDRIDQFLRRMEEEFHTLEQAGKMHEASLEKLEKVVPSIVHMELKDGKPVISQEFWHALRDLLRADGSFVTLDTTGSEYEVSSERQWKAIVSRLVTDPVFSSTLHLAMDDVESKMSGKMTTFWTTWVKDNDEKIAQMLGSAVDQIKSAGSQKEFEERLTKIVKEQLAQTEQQKGGQDQSQLVSRDEFLRHLRNEFAAHRSEIRAELKDLQPQLEQLMQQSVELATREIPHGMSRADVTTLVNGLIRKALADVNLEALARGTIHRHWDSDLRHQVNYFSVGSGAIIDAKHSSSTWDPTSEGVITQEQYTRGLRASKGFPPIAALDPWQDQGDCWCAARSVNHRGNPHGASLAVQLAHRIIPQHIVVEHILPGATTEPNARPKFIEVYAEILDPEVRERILDFGAAFFPDDESDWNFTPPDYHPRFVKITQFVYEAADIHDGVHVHRLSSELMALGAATDHIIVRAVSNYGAKNHTCFYRVRLYGFNPEVDPWS